MDFLKKIWFIPLILFVFVAFVRSSMRKEKMRKRTAKARRTRAKNQKGKSTKKRGSQGPVVARSKSSGGKTWRNTPRTKWTKAMGQAWAKYMKRKRKKK